jgi:membrane-associated phospholipid phosphatase
MFKKRMTRLILLATAIFAVVDALWLPYSQVSVDPSNYVELAKIAGALLAMYAVGKGVSIRLANDGSRIGRFIAHAAESLTILVRAGALFIPLGFVGGIFMYLSYGLGQPLMDDSLARADAALGFNWLGFLAAVNSSHWLSTILVVSYHSVGPQMPALLLVLAFLGSEDRLLEFIGLLAITSLLTAAGMTLVPAAGAYAYFDPRPELFDNFTRHAGMWHYTELMKLRSGKPFVFLAEQYEGMVTFPSFHTVLGIVIAYAVRGVRWLFAPVAVLNAVMIVSTLPEGGHHLVDVLAGIAIALVGLTVVRGLERAPLREKETS